MTSPAAPPKAVSHFPPPDAKTGPSEVALLVWTGIQAAAIAVSAIRWPLSAHFVTPAESAAISVLVIAQAVFAGLLGPVICRDFTSFLTSALVCAPFAALSSRLTGEPFSIVLQAELYIVTLLCVIWLTKSGIYKKKFTQGATASKMRTQRVLERVQWGIFPLVSLLLPLILYCVIDFSNGDLGKLWRLSPPLIAKKLLDGGLSLFSAVFPLFFLLLPTVWWALLRAVFRR